MSKDHAVRDSVHEATHRLPGVPEHHDRPEGHQGATRHGQSAQDRSLHGRGAGTHQGPAVAHDRPPRVLVGWQNWIAALVSRRSD